MTDRSRERDEVILVRRGVAFSKDGLLVTSRHARGQVFDKLKGKYVARFGRQGEDTKISRKRRE